MRLQPQNSSRRRFLTTSAALSVYCHFAVIYRQTPIGLPMPEEFEHNQQYANPNLLLQRLATDAVTSNPLTGLSK
jgi:hypothetical protein